MVKAHDKKGFAGLFLFLFAVICCQSLFGFDFMSAIKDSILDIFKQYVIVIAFLVLGVTGAIWIMQGVSLARVALTVIAVGAFIVFAPDMGSWFIDFADNFKTQHGN